MKTLYLRIYLTVVAALLLFALVAGWLAQRRIDDEQARTQAIWAERAQAWAGLIENSLPAADTPREAQREALLDWSRRLRVQMALDDPQGRRIAVSPRLEERLEQGETPELVRNEMADGRVLWVARRPPREPRQMDGPGPGGPGGPGGLDRGRPLDAPPPLLPWLLPGSGMVLTLLVLFAAVAAGAWPVVRRLTRRLEALKHGVERFGAGELDHRVAVDGRDEVATVAQSFNQAAQRIEDLVRANRSLLANASHELRSPLARLKMALTLMDDAPPARRTELRAEIEHDIRELDELVEEVLFSSRLDAAPQIERQPVDMLGIAAEESARVAAKLAANGLPPGLHVNGEERLLRRALRNLLENARRYGQPAQGADAASSIEMQIEATPADVRFIVRDRGPGVPADQRERIFEPFYRLPGHAEQAGGVGLGLALVRQIAQRHGGSVRCEARLGGGSEFILTVPRVLGP